MLEILYFGIGKNSSLFEIFDSKLSTELRRDLGIYDSTSFYSTLKFLLETAKLNLKSPLFAVRILEIEGCNKFIT